MTKLFSATAALAFAVCSGVTAAQASVALDFDTLNGGSPGSLSNTLTVGVLSVVSDPADRLALYDTSCNAGCTPGGIDPDLLSGTTIGTPDQGLVLITETSKGSGNDDPSSGEFDFTFAVDVFIRKMILIDIETSNVNTGGAPTFTIGGSNADVALTNTDLASAPQPANPATNNSQRTYEFTNAFVSAGTIFRTDMNSSGAIALIEYSPIPLPPALLALGLGLGGLGVAARRQRKARAA